MPNFDTFDEIKIHRTKQAEGFDDDVFWNRHNGHNYGTSCCSWWKHDDDSYFHGGCKYWIGRIFTFTYLTQTRNEPDKRKKKKKYD